MIPEPMTSPDCDLRDFAYMPLDVVRLRDSDIAALATGDEFRCAVLLWCASWHQVPAASLPDDDAILSRLAGFGRAVKEWQRVREGALRGWVKCSDGRLYHPVVAQKANDAWQERLQYRERKAKRIAAAKAAAGARWQPDPGPEPPCKPDANRMPDASNEDAERMRNASDGDANRMPDASTTTCRKGEGEGKGYPHSPLLRSASRGRGKSPDPPALPDWLDLGAWEQWERYRRSRKGWTVDAKALSLRKLAELRAAGHEPRAVIEQSILQGWSGLFPLRSEGPRGASSMAASEFAGAK